MIEKYTATDEIINDARHIHSIEVGVEGDCGILHTVGSCGVVRIDVATVAGQGAWVPWFNVWDSERIIERINAAFVWRVTYTPAAGGDDE